MAFSTHSSHIRKFPWMILPVTFCLMIIQHRMAFLFCFYQLQDTSDVQVCSGHRGSIKSLCFSTDSFQLACYRRLECIACCRCCFWQFCACIGSSCILWIGSSSSCMRFFVYTSGTLNWCKDFDIFTVYPSRCNNLPSFHQFSLIRNLPLPGERWPRDRRTRKCTCHSTHI